MANRLGREIITDSGRVVSRRIMAAAGALCLLLSQSSGVEASPYPPDAKIISMGDSIAAGTGAGNYHAGTDTDENRCRRSKNAAGEQVARRLGMTDYLNIACRGASINNLYYGQYGEPGQLEQIPEDTDVILLSLGGNVADLAAILRNCQENTCHPDDAEVMNILARLNSNELRQELQEAYTDILDAAPKATIYASLYSKPIEPRGFCPTIVSPEVDWFASAFVDNLNSAITQAATEMNSPRVIVVDPPQYVDACMTFGQGITAQGEDIGHPTASTQSKIASQIIRSMQKNTITAEDD